MIIEGDSMLPTYRNLQLVLLDKTADDYNRGDVIAFYNYTLEGRKIVLVKRIAGITGDEVELETGTVTLSDGEFYVLGDNLPESIDSRYAEVGVVDREDIIGKVI